MTKNELEALGREHGLELDKRKTVADLKKDLADAGIKIPDYSKTADDSVDVEILRDVWDAKGQRQHKGSVISVPTDTAFDWLENGLAKRAKAQ